MPCYQGTGLGCPVALLAGFVSKDVSGSDVASNVRSCDTDVLDSFSDVSLADLS